MPPDRWELGSDFHWPMLEPLGAERTPPWHHRSRRFGCGRDALRAVIEHGKATRGWHRLLVPSYMCQEVLVAAAASGLNMEAYPDRPTSVPAVLAVPTLSPEDVVLEVNFLGLRGRPFVRVPEGIDVIEDHTHDPWSEWARHSTAAFAFASLRKTLPLPSGGVVWSPAGLELPAPRAATPERRAASADKLKAMLLKSLYLAGYDIAKADFRELAVSSEATMAAGPVSGIPPGDSQLGVFPVEAWRLIRHRNHSHLSERLQNTPGLRVLQTDASGSVPFSFVVVFDEPSSRDAIRDYMIQRDIYPAVLWPLHDPVVAGIGEDDIAFSRQMLSIPCDWRYTVEDMDAVAATLLAGMAELRGRGLR